MGLAINSVGHAVLACYKDFINNSNMREWADSPKFKKVTCKVTDEEFERAKEFENKVVMTESALDGNEVSMAFCPRHEYPKFFKYLRLYK